MLEALKRDPVANNFLSITGFYAKVFSFVKWTDRWRNRTHVFRR